MSGKQLARLQFDLAYLALLTKYHLKRLSRWEGAVSPEGVAILRDLGLEVAHVKRRLLLGRKTDETVFSRERRWTDLYRARFDMTRIGEKPHDVRFKGFLFGYPSCCVEAFIKKPYSKNDLLPKDQELLFHWACQGCKLTPHLLKEYRGIHQECVRIFGGMQPARTTPLYQMKPKAHGSLAQALQRGALPAAMGLSALLMLPHAGQTYGSRVHSTQDGGADPHLLPVADDMDEDYLSYAEEVVLGMDPHNADIDGDSELDGIEEANLVKGLIDSLPLYEWGDPEIPSDRPYAIDMAMCGVIECAVCGEMINMGFITIVNPLRELQVDVPYINLHYLEHESLSSSAIWWPEEVPRESRLDLAGFKRVLLGDDESHLICSPDYLDPDMDGLESDEELMLGTDADLPDTDGDSVRDGPQFVEEDLIEALSALPREEREDGPYLIENHLYGVETCDICGATFNMGCAHIVNPIEDLSLDVPFIALHYLGHGSSGYAGSVNQGRVLPILLRTVVTGDGTSHWLDVDGDGDSDGLKDEEEAHFSLNPAIDDTDGDGVLDGPELATLMHSVIGDLPEGPLPDSTYIISHLVRGTYHCLVCGEGINMGYVDVVNPHNGTSITVGYYHLHFMSHGSFSTDRPDLYPRIDPRDIDAVIDISSHASRPQTPAVPKALEVYPNPFRTKTNIVCGLEGRKGIGLTICDASGRQVKDLASALGSGKHVFWDGTDSEGRKLPPGVYFCKLKAGDCSFSRKVVLLD